MKIIAGAKRALAVALIACMMLPQTLLAQNAVDESPNEFAMVGDLLVARPIGAVMVVGGAAVWLVSLPFTLLAGHAGEAADTLIAGPVETTFMRCLGCRNTGYTDKDLEFNKRKKAEEEAAAAAAAAEQAAQ